MFQNLWYFDQFVVQLLYNLVAFFYVSNLGMLIICVSKRFIGFYASVLGNFGFILTDMQRSAKISDEGHLSHVTPLKRLVLKFFYFTFAVVWLCVMTTTSDFFYQCCHSRLV